jgi:hypothetical protein
MMIANAIHTIFRCKLPADHHRGWRRLSVALLLLGATASRAAAADVTIHRNGWLPNNDPAGPYVTSSFDTPGRAPDERQKGDIYTFNCPRSATIEIRVDTKDDGDGRAHIDPHLWVYDGTGAVGFREGDDEIACTYQPVCGPADDDDDFYQCARVAFTCGPNNPYTIIVTDSGPHPGDVGSDRVCTGGGGYKLTVSASAGDGGETVSKKSLKFSGRDVKLPDWLAGKTPAQAPLIDDGQVPVRLEEPSL